MKTLVAWFLISLISFAQLIIVYASFVSKNIIYQISALIVVVSFLIFFGYEIGKISDKNN